VFDRRLYFDISKRKAALGSAEGLLVVRLALFGILASSQIRGPFLACMAELEEFLEKGEACSSSLRKFRNHSFSCHSLRGRECFRIVSF